MLCPSQISSQGGREEGRKEGRKEGRETESKRESKPGAEVGEERASEREREGNGREGKGRETDGRIDREKGWDDRNREELRKGGEERPVSGASEDPDADCEEMSALGRNQQVCGHAMPWYCHPYVHVTPHYGS